MKQIPASHPSLENLIETENIGIEIFHPGGLQITDELAHLCQIGKDAKVLDVASGTGEGVCYLTQQFRADLTAVDLSNYLLQKARNKAAKRNLKIRFVRGDAHSLPFLNDTFHSVISECTTCALQKEKAIREMMRVTRAGGYVGIHDLFWRENAPESLKRRLMEIENENPETLKGWRALFERAGLTKVIILEKPNLLQDWTRKERKQIGIKQELKIFLKIWKKWGFEGVKRVSQSEQVFKSQYISYGIVVGQKKG